MRRSGKTGEFPFVWAGRVPFLALSLGLTAALWSGGCSNTNSAALKGTGDPLFGDPAVLPKGTAVPATPTRFGKPAASAPRPTGSTPASLVNNTEIPGLQGAKPLAIGAGWQRDPTAPGTSAPKVMPVPLEKSSAPGLLNTGAWTPEGAKVTPVGGDPIARLQSLGAIGIRQQPVPGGIRVTCFFPSNASPGSTRLVEATAPTLPDAVEAIIQKNAR